MKKKSVFFLSYEWVVNEHYLLCRKKIKVASITYDFLSCGDQTRTDDLWVMSPTSYQLLHSAILLCFNECKYTAFSYTTKLLSKVFIVFFQIFICSFILSSCISSKISFIKSSFIEHSLARWISFSNISEYLSVCSILMSFSFLYRNHYVYTIFHLFIYFFIMKQIFWKN